MTIQRQIPTPPRTESALPADVPSFVGRMESVERLRALVSSRTSTPRAVAIHAVDGMAGVGKTAFAIHVGHQISEWFPDGQWFLPLRAHSPGEEKVSVTAALETLLQADGVGADQIPSSDDARAALWRDRMANKRLLLILDDAADAAHVEPLLPSASGCLVLVTSRRKLGTLAATEFLTLDVLSLEEAADLFRERVGQRAGQDPGAVDEIVRLCGYLPLAVTLTAARLRLHPAWTPQDLLEDLREERNHVDGTSSSDLAIAVSFRLSYRDLDPKTQTLFLRCVLHFGHDFDDYAAVALADLPLQQARTGLEKLLEHNLLTEWRRGRYQFHDLIAQYGHYIARSVRAWNSQDCRNRLSDYYLASAAAASRHQAKNRLRLFDGGPANGFIQPSIRDRVSSTRWIVDELPALSDACAWAASIRRTDVTIGIPAALHNHLRTHGPWSLAVHLHELALNEARRVNDRRAQAYTLVNFADTRRLDDDYMGALDMLNEAIELCTDLDDQAGQVDALLGLARVQYLASDYLKAKQHLMCALGVAEQINSLNGRANAMHQLGILSYVTSNFEDAKAKLRLSLDLYQEAEDIYGQAEALNVLGVVSYVTGGYSEAQLILSQSLSLFRELGDRHGEANVLDGLGEAQQLAGDLTGAESTYNKALLAYGGIGDRHGQASVLTVLGRLQHQIGDPAAATTLTEALSLFEHLGKLHGQANALAALGELQSSLGNHDAAMSRLASALQFYGQVGDEDGVSEVSNLIGQTLLFNGDPGAAERVFSIGVGRRVRQGGSAGSVTRYGQAAHVPLGPDG